MCLIQGMVWYKNVLTRKKNQPNNDFCRNSIFVNHRMVGVGRDLCGSSSPTLLPKQGHLQQAAQDLVQAGLEYLQRRRLHSLPGQPGPGLCHPQREEVLPHVQLKLPLLQFVPVAHCPVTGHHWKELGPILLTPTLQIFVSMVGPVNRRQESQLYWWLLLERDSLCLVLCSHQCLKAQSGFYKWVWSTGSQIVEE